MLYTKEMYSRKRNLHCKAKMCGHTANSTNKDFWKFLKHKTIMQYRIQNPDPKSRIQIQDPEYRSRIQIQHPDPDKKRTHELTYAQRFVHPDGSQRNRQ